MKALVATKNEGKIESAKKALSIYFENIEIIGISVKSDVSEQPVNDEIFEGAKNRIRNLKKYAKDNKIHTDLYMSVESGINKLPCGWVISNFAIIEDKEGLVSYGMGPSFPVPDRYIKDIIETDFSNVMNKVFGKDEERHNRGGGIQMLTKGQITRVDSSKIAFIMALTKFINGEIWR